MQNKKWHNTNVLIVENEFLIKLLKKDLFALPVEVKFFISQEGKSRE